MAQITYLIMDVKMILRQSFIENLQILSLLHLHTRSMECILVLPYFLQKEANFLSELCLFICLFGV